MRRLNLLSSAAGNIEIEKPYYLRLSEFSHGYIEINIASISLKNNNGRLFRTNIRQKEKNAFSEIFQGTFEDNT